MVRDGARRNGDAEAIVSHDGVDGDRRIDFATLRTMVDGAARALLAIGIEPGDRVAVWAPNSPEWIVAALGITTVGGVLVPINTRFRGAEAGYVLARSGARGLFTVRGFLDTDYPALLASAGVELRERPCSSRKIAMESRPLLLKSLRMGELQMDWLRSEDLKEVEVVTAPWLV